MAKAKAFARNLLLALILVPVLLFGGNLVMDSLTTWLDEGCVRVGADAVLCLHRAS